MRTIHILWLDVSREFLFHFSCNRPANLSRNALTDKWEGLLPVLLLRWIYLADTLLFCYVDMTSCTSSIALILHWCRLLMKKNSFCIAIRGMDSIWSLNRHNDPFRTKQTWNSWVSFKFWIISPLLIWRHLNWLNLDSARGSRYKFFSKNSISIHYKHFKIKKVLIHLSRTNITWYLKCFKAIGGICN